MGAQPRVGVREVPGGFFSSYLVHQVQPGDTIEVLPPSGTFTADLSVPGDHVFVVAGRASRRRCRWPAPCCGTDVDRHRLLRQPAHQHGDVRRRAGRPEGPLRHPAAAGARALREPRDELTSGRLDGARLRALVENLVDAPNVDHWWLCGPHGMVDDARALLTELGVPGEGAPGALLRRRDPAGAGARRRGDRHRPEQPGDRRPRRPLHDPGPPPRRVRPRLGAEGARPALRLQGGVCGTCRRRSPTARWSCGGTTRWRPRRSTPATC